MTDKTPDFLEPGKDAVSAKDAPKTAAKAVVDPPSPHHADPAGLLTAAEIEDIRAKARAEIMADKRTKAKQEVLASEKLRLQREEGLTTGNGHQDQVMSITIDLAPYAPYINYNGQCYWHGRTYHVPRHVADSLRDQMFLTWKHQNQIDGKDANQFYAAKHVAEMYKVEGGAKISAAAH